MPRFPVDFARVRAVTFDAGGTLLTPDPGVGEVYAEILERHRVELAPAILNQRFRAAFKEWTAAFPRPVVNEETALAFWRRVVGHCITPECPENLAEKVFGELWSEFASARRWRALPGVETTLKTLSARPQLRLGVLSNWDSRLHRVLDELDWTKYFSQVFISSEISAEKPDGRAFRAVEAALDLPAAACLHVGDSLAHDYQAALDAGWQAVLVAPVSPAPEVYCVTRLDELTHVF